ncbi:Gfo/Idh/MocA family oxidoreductase [Paenarthrobacter sp. Z7-10]|uniref:Gfo/Idh/MocA family protein n=1 Tax=Paenarthrobacter sp. Z7-10 TaxID=2787635 RepID=UPI0022A9026E|nr:Gfo/Idh/MocA family oxidoreductase [Paenarthrobacter sp. Z7-10]MCZ2402887.1 Gfo/Idh/MocA family oxidoreductase [Paenarthrobacter sp. Z7-10]
MTELKVGLVGSGGITGVHVPAWLALGAKVTVYSLEGAEELAGRYGLKVAPTLEELLECADIVDICTPTASHSDISLAAIRAGKDIICEKPVARTVAEGTAVLRAARAAGVQIYPGHVVRFFPEYAAAKAAIDAGRLGIPAILRFSRGGAGPLRDWFYDQEQSGGLIMDQMIHDLDQARWLAGEVTQVYAIQHPATAAGKTPRTVSAHVTLTHHSGAISHIQGVWGPATMEFRTSFDLAGDAGSLHFDSAADASVVSNLGQHNEASYLPAATGAESPYLTQIREFAAAISGGPAPRVSFDDGLVALALAEAANESLRSGQAVPFAAPQVAAAQSSTR